MSEAGERMLEGAREMVAVAKGEQPAASITVKGHRYIPVEQAYEIAAEWHDKNARGCRDIAADYLRVGTAVAQSANEAAKHHAASAAGLRNAAIQLRRARSVSITVKEIRDERTRNRLPAT